MGLKLGIDSSLVPSSYNADDILPSFGGYNGSYNNEVNVLNNIDAESSFDSRLDGIATRVDALESVRTNLADEEAKLDSAQLKVITFITANMGLSCTLMFGALALGRGVFHAKAWNLYVFYFPTLIVICVGFLMRMAVASRRIRSWKWDKLMIHSKGRFLKTDVLKVEDLLKLLAGDRNRLGRHLGHFVDIEHRVRDLLRSLEDVYADDDKLYLRFAIGFFFITVSVFSALAICMDMLPPHSSTPAGSSAQ